VPPTDFAFDALAATYDAQFTDSRIGTLMRQAVWQRLDACFHPGQRILELNCGTGADAVYLGQYGVRVLATDLSPAMVQITRQKVARAGLTAMVQVQQLALENIAALKAAPFDGALSNFGGLNCVADLAGVGRALGVGLVPLPRCSRDRLSPSAAQRCGMAWPDHPLSIDWHPATRLLTCFPATTGQCPRGSSTTTVC